MMIEDVNLVLGGGEGIKVWRAADHDLAGIYLTVMNDDKGRTVSFTVFQKEEAKQVAQALLAWASA